jgi:hypothetical protein
VVVGTPTWGKSVAAPVRTFLAEQRGRLPQVAFFLTDGSAQHEGVFRDMATLAGPEPMACLGLPHDTVRRGRYADQLAAVARSPQAVKPG